MLSRNGRRSFSAFVINYGAIYDPALNKFDFGIAQPIFFIRVW
jgi:hypothetical protein